MEEYVTKEKALAQLERCARDPYHETHYLRDEVINTIRRMEAADVVEVVRCKDCKWFNRFGCAIEMVDFTDRPTENDYCSFGEREDDED